MKLSVIVVNYNGRLFISQCIDSILRSNYPDYEVIIVDNASSDKSFDFIKKEYRMNKKVKVFRLNKQLYFTGGSNFGAKKASGKILFFINSDIILDKKCLGELVKFNQNHPKYLSQPKILRYHQKKMIDCIGGRYRFPGFGIAIGRNEIDTGQYNENMAVDYVNATAFMIDRNFFWKIGGFDQKYKYFYEDVDLALRAGKLEGKCFYCYKAKAFHKGSFTFKQNVSEKTVSHYMRRNRILTVVKSKKGLPLFCCLVFLTISHFLLSLKDYCSEIRTKVFSINSFRFKELKKVIGKNKFSLLDLGCGSGDFVAFARNQGIVAVGVDKKAVFHPYFIHSSIEKLKLEKKFDAITLYHVLEHVNNPESVLKKIKKLLNKKGVVVLEVPLAENLTEKYLGKSYFAYNDKTHRHFFSKKNLSQLLKKAGFKVIKKGFTLYEFPVTVITAGFRKSIFKGVLSLFIFLPLKVLTILRINEEVVRVYCVVSDFKKEM